jgi:hypothetical protein
LADQSEPFDGYADASVDDVRTHIEATPEGDARETVKAAIRAAESRREQPRKGVLDLTEPVHVPEVTGAPAEVPDPGPGRDLSGRPPLAEVAAERAASVPVRHVIDDTTTEED